jgi:hypothetical protein
VRDVADDENAAGGMGIIALFSNSDLLMSEEFA